MTKAKKFEELKFQAMCVVNEKEIEKKWALNGASDIDWPNQKTSRD